MVRLSRSSLRLGFFGFTLAVVLSVTFFWPTPNSFSIPILLGVAALIAICYVFPLIISTAEISLAHVVGLGAVFAFGPTLAAWALVVGLVGGEAVRIVQLQETRRAHWEHFAAEFTLQILSLLAASGVFLLSSGQFPVIAVRQAELLQLGAFSVLYLAFYSGLVILKFDSLAEATRVFTGLSLNELIALEILPLPVAVYAAVGYQAIGLSLFVVLGGGLAMIAASLHTLTRTQTALRQQVRENTRLYGEAQARLRELTLLHEAGSTLTSTLDRRTIHITIAREVSEVVSADECVLVDYDDDAGLMRTAYTWVREGQKPRHTAQAYPLNTYPGIMRLLTEHAPVAFRADTNDLGPDAAKRLRQSGFGALLILPLATSEQVIGLVEVYTLLPRAFTEAEVRLAQTIANQAAIALANASLFFRATEGRDRLVAVLNSTRDGALVIDASGTVSLVNPRLEEIWGIPAGRLVGQNLLRLLNTPELDIATKLGYQLDEIIEMLQTLKAGLALSISKTQYVVHEPKRRFIERSGAPVLDQFAKAIGWVITLRDMTEEKEIQEVREGLTNMIVHDLRSPLTVVLTSLGLVRSQMGDSPIVAQAVAVGGRSVNRMVTMVNTLLDIARIESGTFTLQRSSVNPRELADELITDLTPTANEQGIVLINEAAPTAPEVFVDREKVGRVFMNLLDNALKFTPAGGRIWVRIENHAPASDAPAMLQCAVADTGPGIPDDYREKIFDRFVQIQGRAGRRSGTGLGLAFCKLVIEAHGGKIWVENLPEGGSAFCFTLPIGGGSPYYYGQSQT